MKPIRILLAAILGGVIMFVWGAVSHMALPIGEMGLKGAPDNPALLDALRQNLTDHAAYMLPPMDLADESDSAIKAYAERYRAGPRGLIIYDPSGGEMMSPRQLGTEFAADLLACLLGAIVLAASRGGYIARVLLAALIGLAAWLSIDVSYWNWYRFPDGLALGSLIDQAVGWFLAGLGMAALLPRCCTQRAGASPTLDSGKR
jgi:hypothetical protein